MVVLLHPSMEPEDSLGRFYRSFIMSQVRQCREAWDVSFLSLIYTDLVRYGICDSVSDLASVLGTDKSTVSRKVDALVRDGYLVKGADPDDGRSRRLGLSERTSGMYDRMDAPYRRALDRMKGEMTPEQLEAFAAGIRILAEEIDRG